MDLRGFGDSGTTDGSYDVATSAEGMHCLVEHFGTGAVYVLCQDLSGGPGFRFADTHPADVLSFSAVEASHRGDHQCQIQAAK